MIDTTFADTDEVVRKIMAGVPAGERPFCWMDPRNLVPTKRVEEIRGGIADTAKAIGQGHSDPGDPVRTLYVDHVFYVSEGHARVAAALRGSAPFVAATVAAANDQPYTAGLTARQHIRETVDASLISEWEQAVGFRFQDDLWQGRSARGEGSTSRARDRLVH